MKRTRVLVLDSDPEFLIELERVLEESGFDATITWDIREAVRLLAARPFEAMLVGEHPPDVKTTELLKELGSSRQHPAVIVLESDARYPFQAQYLCALGAHAVVPKWKHKRVLDTLRQVTTAPQQPGESSSASA